MINDHAVLLSLNVYNMRRSRRSAVTARKPKAKVSDDDFESETGDSTSNENGDFSASEDEWLPGKEGKTKNTSGEHSEEYEETDELDNEEEYNTSQEEDSASDKSSVVFKQNKSSKKSPKQLLKRKRLSPGTRDELYKRTKKHLLKEANPELPPLNSSVSDILEKCKFQRKRNLSQSQERVTVLKKKRAEEDSDSSGDDHLVDPEKLDLNSKFFEAAQEVEPNAAPPQFDCNAGMRLSDDSSDQEQDEPLPASIPKTAAVKLINKINESSSGYLNFNNHDEFTLKIEEAKKLLRNYELNENKSEAAGEKSEGDQISNLLALGEAEAGSSSGICTETGPKHEYNDASEESDWEEVEEARKSQQSTEQQSNRDAYQISVEVETSKSKKKRWEEIEMELYIKRQINKVKRENQMAYHKTSVLCAIAVGRKLNELASSGKLCAILLSLMQSKQCQVKGKVDVKPVELLLKWFKETFELSSQQIFSSERSNLKFNLSLGLFTHKIACKRDYLLLFLASMRAAGIESRLVLSASVPSKRPAMKDLCPISERQLIEQFEKEYCKKKPLIVKPDEISNDLKIQPNIEECKVEIECNLVDKASEVKESLEQVPQHGSTEKETNSSMSSKQSEIENRPRVTRSRSKQSYASKEESKPSIRFSLTPENIRGKRKSKSVSPSSTKENLHPTKGILRNPSPNLVAMQSTANETSTQKVFNSLNIPQLDGVNDLESTPNSASVSRRLRSHVAKAEVGTTQKGPHFSKRRSNTPTIKATVKEQNNNQPGKVLKRKLYSVDAVVKTPPENPENNVPANNKILTACSSSERETPSPKKTQRAASRKKRPSSSKTLHSDSGNSDFEPPDSKKKKIKKSPNVKSKPAPKKTLSKKKSNPSTKKEKTDLNASDTAAGSSNKVDMWVEFFSEKQKKWLTVDLFAEKIDCPDYLARHATSPISYVFGFDNEHHIKDITARYVQHWNTVCRKLRCESKWLSKTLKPFCAEKSERDLAEDNELNKIHIDKPLPTTIAECKNHPLYVLKRHLLKFEALYPPDLPSLGFVRGEAIYARECLFILQTREKWFKQARVVKPFETAYKVVKCWKYDKPKNEWLYQPCDIFGIWQTEDYDPPTAENGIVPRNEYGNVELFAPRMLPKKTVHLQLPGLNRVCRRLGIDCAPALTGFEMARMRMVPVYDGFVVCEEFANQAVEEWYKEMEQEERKEQEKFEKRVYGNWKKLIRGLLVRRKLQNKYNFDNL